MVAYWHNKGWPVIDPKAPRHDLPWFPWTDAGFTEQEHRECIQDMLQIAVDPGLLPTGFDVALGDRDYGANLS